MGLSKNFGHSRSALLAPSFWIALVVLVLNDHVLKGSGLLPALLTGKLSDFAGLIVAPVVAAELVSPLAGFLLGPRKTTRAWLRGLSAGSVVVAFIALQLSPAFAHLVERAAACVGVGVAIWSDPDDLMALLVLPWTARLLSSTRAVTTGAWAVAGERVLAVAAAFACMATSAVDGTRGPFLVNHSEGELTVQMRWYEQDELCDEPVSQLPTRIAALPRPDTHTLTLPHAGIARLYPPPLSDNDNVGQCPYADYYAYELEYLDASQAPRCVVVVIEADGLPTHVLRSDPVRRVDGVGHDCRTHIPVYEDPGLDALVLTGQPGVQLKLRAHSGVQTVQAP